MEATVNFTVVKNELLEVLKQLQKVERSARKKESTLEVTIIDDFIQMLIPGIQLQIKAITTGSAKFTIRLWYFTDIVKAEKGKELHFTLIENQLKLRGFSFGVYTTFFETDSILRSISLPINFTHLDIARLYLSEKYTTDEILFNNLDTQVVSALQRVKSDIDKIAFIMRNYGFSRKDVEELLFKKLKENEK